MCTQSSLIYTPEMGVHGMIEFGNRVLTFLLLAIAVASIYLVRRHSPERTDLRRLSMTVLIGILVQAGVGGLTVLLRLHPGAVGVHYLLSVVLVVLATVFVHRSTRPPLPSDDEVTARQTRRLRTLVMSVLCLAALSIVLGTLTTGAGPHAGDDLSARNDLNLNLLQHLHAWAGYALIALSLVAVILSFTTGNGATGRILLLAVTLEALQIGLGIAQARLGLPAALVGAHMLIAIVIVSALTAAALRLPGRTHPSRSPSSITHDVAAR